MIKGTIFLLFITLLNSTNSQIKQLNLSDDEKRASENFVHQTKTKQIIDEMCKGKREECRGDETDRVVISDQMVSMAAKAYTMLINLDLLMGKSAEFETYINVDGDDSKEVVADDGTKTKGDGTEDKISDYCKYIPIASEAIALFRQTMVNQEIGSAEVDPAMAQSENLYKAARQHDERANTNKIQFVGWTATASCYAVMSAIAMPSWNSAMIYVKLAGSTTLAVFTGLNMKAHQDAANEVRKIADALPKKGDCNPVTQRQSFCSDPTSAGMPEYKSYCQVITTRKNVKKGKVYSSCVDDQLNADPTCACERTGNCFDKKYMSMIDGSGIGFGDDFNTAVENSVTELAHGEIADFEVGGLKAKNALNRLNKLIDNIPDKLVPDNLNKNQLAMAKELTKLNLNPKAAHMVAAVPDQASKRNMAKVASLTGGGLAGKKAYKPYARTASRLRKIKVRGPRKARKSNTLKFQMPNFNKKKKAKKGSKGRYLSFAKKAQKNADINKRSDISIFDILSNRYRVSGRKRLEGK